MKNDADIAPLRRQTCLECGKETDRAVCVHCAFVKMSEDREELHRKSRELANRNQVRLWCR